MRNRNKILDINCKRVTFSILLGLLGFVLVIALTMTFSDIFVDLECKTFDYRMRARGAIKSNPDIILIDIDDRSIDSIGRWPWDRTIHAKMIEALSVNKTNTIAYDILFYQPSPQTKSDDILAKATREAERVYYPVGFEFAPSNLDGSTIEESDHLEILKPFGFGRFIGETKRILSVKRAIAPISKIFEASKGLGHISSNRDNDGIIRRAPLLVEMNSVLFPSFALITVMDYLNVAKDNIIIKPGKSITLKEALFPNEEKKRNIVIPIDDKGMMLINYAGVWSKSFNHYSFKNIYNRIGVSGNEEELPSFNDNIIIVCNAASGHDIKPIPLENNYPGGGIHANIINTILTENFLVEADVFIKIGIILILSIIGSLVGFLIKWHLKAMSLFFLLSGYIIMSFYLFKSCGIVLPLISPSIALILGSMLVSFYQIQSTRGDLLTLGKEKKKFKTQLELVSSKLAKKENEIAGILKKLSVQENYASNIHLKDRLRAKRDEKESLEKKKIMILRNLSPFEAEKLRHEAEKFNIISRNSKLLEAFDLAKRVAPTDHGVLLLGESGTGKELFVRAIHAMSNRKQAKLVSINVAAIVPTLAESELFGHVKGAFAGADRNREGLFQRAHKGTIFLDEIGNLHSDIQAKLLRILQDGEVRPVGSSTSAYIDVRVIAATDKNLEMEVKSGRFNKALFSRLNRYPIILPPLRERSEDIPYLADEFIKRHKEERDISGISKEAIEALCKWHWPENIRQLEHVIIRALVNTQHKKLQNNDIQYAIEQASYAGYVPQDIKEKGDRIEVKEKKENKQGEKEDYFNLIAQLRKTKFNMKETCEILDINRNTLTDNFKGICFKYLAENNGDIKDAALAIADSPDISKKVESKIREYYKNLKLKIKDCKNSQMAKEKCSKIFKNIPKVYFQYIEILVDKYFTVETF